MRPAGALSRIESDPGLSSWAMICRPFRGWSLLTQSFPHLTTQPRILSAYNLGLASIFAPVDVADFLTRMPHSTPVYGACQ